MPHHPRGEHSHRQPSPTPATRASKPSQSRQHSASTNGRQKTCSRGTARDRRPPLPQPKWQPESSRLEAEESATHPSPRPEDTQPLRGPPRRPPQIPNTYQHLSAPVAVTFLSGSIPVVIPGFIYLLVTIAIIEKRHRRAKDTLARDTRCRVVYDRNGGGHRTKAEGRPRGR